MTPSRAASLVAFSDPLNSHRPTRWLTHARIVNRIRTTRDSEPIAAALHALPESVVRAIGPVHWLAGSDPVFAGLHRFDTGDGLIGARSYRSTAHCVWPTHLSSRPRSERCTTVVLPTPEQPWVVLHELGHALDQAVGFDCPELPIMLPHYDDRYERFACWFEMAFTPREWLPEWYPRLRLPEQFTAFLSEIGASHA